MPITIFIFYDHTLPVAAAVRLVDDSVCLPEGCVGLAAGPDCAAAVSVFSLSSAGLSSEIPLDSSPSGCFSGAGEGSDPAGPCGPDRTEWEQMNLVMKEGWTNKGELT